MSRLAYNRPSNYFQLPWAARVPAHNFLAPFSARSGRDAEERSRVDSSFQVDRGNYPRRRSWYPFNCHQREGRSLRLARLLCILLAHAKNVDEKFEDVAAASLRVRWNSASPHEGRLPSSFLTSFLRLEIYPVEEKRFALVNRGRTYRGVIIRNYRQENYSVFFYQILL